MSIRPDAHRAPPPPPPGGPRKPVVNLPRAVAWLIGLNVAVYLLSAAMPLRWTNELIFDLGFIPARYALPGGPGWQGLVSPLTHQFLHAGSLHILINMIMLAAFGAGVERLMGARRLLGIFFLSGIAGAALHYGFYPDSRVPVVGASGAISGLFGAVLRLMAKQGEVMGRRTRVLPIAALWIGISVVTGVTGVPGSGGAQVAWAAHIGGFLLGLAAFDLFTIGLGRRRPPPHLRDLDDDGP